MEPINPEISGQEIIPITITAYHTCCQVYKIKISKLPVYHYERLFLNSDENLPRTGDNIKRIDSKLSLGRSHFFYQASSIWSILPNETKKSENFQHLKRNAKHGLNVT